MLIHPVEIRGLICRMKKKTNKCRMLAMRVRPATPDRGYGNVPLRVELAPKVELAPDREQVTAGTVRAIATSGGRQTEPVRLLVQGGLEVGRRTGVPGTEIRRLIQLPTV